VCKKRALQGSSLHVFVRQQRTHSYCDTAQQFDGAESVRRAKRVPLRAAALMDPSQEIPGTHACEEAQRARAINAGIMERFVARNAGHVQLLSATGKSAASWAGAAHNNRSHNNHAG